MLEKGFHPEEEFGQEKYSAYGMALWCIEEGQKSLRPGAHLCIAAMKDFRGDAADVSDGSPSIVADDGVWRAPSEAEPMAEPMAVEEIAIGDL